MFYHVIPIQFRSSKELAMADIDSTVDLLVFGGGMAGMSAAARACSDGASVVLVEKGPAIGGSAMYAGFIWTAPTVEVMREVNPDADPELSARVVEGYGEALDWVRSLGVSVADPVTVLGYGRGCATDMANYLLACERIVSERGERIVGATAERLIVEDGAVVGAEIADKHGERRAIRARATVLATGGFGGDPELRAEYIHPLARNLPLRAQTHSVGDGMRLGRQAGAAFGPPNAGFYGHLIPSRVAYNNPYEFTDLTFYHSEHGVLLNLAGDRFCDETVGDHLNTLYVLEQQEARALLIYDQRVHDEWEMAEYVEGVEPLDKFQLAYKRGARSAIADDIEEFEYLPEEWGYSGTGARDALLEFNRQCEAGTPNPPRAVDAAPLVTPPYYVIEVIPAITFTFGGLTIDAHARVLDESGDVIPGLLAAGADAGGVFNRAYAGGLACALVFGLQAAATATAGHVTAR
jgi:succinate dehydrogenase/fumarate reductase flavoprotein subunit